MRRLRAVLSNVLDVIADPLVLGCSLVLALFAALCAWGGSVTVWSVEHHEARTLPRETIAASTTAITLPLWLVSLVVVLLVLVGVALAAYAFGDE